MTNTSVRREENAEPAAGAPQHAGSPRFFHPVTLAVLLIAPFIRILAAPGGRVLGNPHGDSLASYFFYIDYMGRCWREGIVPLWNPYIMTGVPFLGDGEGSVFHPLALLFSLGRPDLAINGMVAIAFVLTGLFFYGYLRALGLGRPAAWCGAAAWSFSSAPASRIYAGHLNILLGFISWPAILMFWERYRARGRALNLAGIAAAYALLILAYYPQLLFTFSLFFLVYVLVENGVAAAFPGAGGTRADVAQGEAKKVFALGAAILLGIGVGAVQLLPSLDFVAESFRQKATLEFCGRFSFPPENFLTLLAPHFLQTPQTLESTVYWGRNFFWEMWIYLGLLPLMLAAAGAFAAPRGRAAALLACAGVFLVLGLGRHTPLFPLLYRYAPGFNIFRGSSKHLVIVLWCLAVLAAYGFEALFFGTDEARRRRAMRAALGAGAVLFAAALAVLVLLVRGAESPGSAWSRGLAWIQHSGEFFEQPSTSPEVIRATAALAGRELIRALILIALGAALIAAPWPEGRRRFLGPAAAVLMLADLLGVFLPMMSTFDRSLAELKLEWDGPAPSQPCPPRILNANSLPLVSMKTGYSAIFGYTGNTLKRYNDFISLVQGQNPDESRAAVEYARLTPHYKMLALDAVAMDRDKIPQALRPAGRIGSRLLIPWAQIGEPSPRAWLAAAPCYTRSREDALQYVFSGNANPLASPVIEGPSGVPPHPLEPDEAVRVVSYAPQRVELEAQAKYPRELILCEAYEHNWAARVNGRAVPVAPANTVFRAVRLEAGPSRVVFEYRPQAFYRGAALSVLSLALLLAFCFFARARYWPHAASHGKGLIHDPAR